MTGIGGIQKLIKRIEEMLDAAREFHHVSREIKVGFLLTWLSAYPTCFSVLVCVFRIAS